MMFYLAEAPILDFGLLDGCLYSVFQSVRQYGQRVVRDTLDGFLFNGCSMTVICSSIVHEA